MPTLTPKQQQVRDLLAEDKTPQEIAEIIGGSVQNVYNHRRNIDKRLNGGTGTRRRRRQAKRETPVPGFLDGLKQQVGDESGRLVARRSQLEAEADEARKVYEQADARCRAEVEQIDVELATLGNVARALNGDA
jgi:hypothetical protein